MDFTRVEHPHDLAGFGFDDLDPHRGSLLEFGDRGRKQTRSD